MFWVNDLPQASGLASLGVAAQAAAIEIGVGVLAVDRWDASQVAKAIEVAGIDPSRLTIGIGAGQLMVGAQAAVRRAAADLADRGVRRVVVGSLGPKLTRIGGEVADGVLLNWVSPAAAGELAGVAISGASASSRQPWIGSYTRVAVARAAEERLRAECAAYEGYPAYARHFARIGVGAMETSAFGEREEVQRWLDGFDGILDHVVVRAIAASETIEGYLDVLHAAAPSKDGNTAR